MNVADREAAAGLAGDPSAMTVFTEIAIIAHLAETLFESVLPHGLTNAQYGVLNHLLRLDAEQTIGELAAAFQVSQPTMSSTVRRLEDKGFVVLRHDPDDRRVRRVAVTEDGAQARADGLAAFLALQKTIGPELPADELRDILPVLTRLRRLLDARR